MKKWLCLMLVLAMCLTSLPGVAEAVPEVEAASEAVEEQVEAAGEIGIPGLTVEDGDQPEGNREVVLQAEADGEQETAIEDSPRMEGEDSDQDVSNVGLSVSVKPAAIVIGVKEVYRGLNVQVVDADGLPVEDAVVTWRSAREKTAKVSADGAVTGVKKGETTLTASVAGGGSCSVNVTVMKAPTKVSLNPTTLLLGPGTTAQLTPIPGDKTASGQYTYETNDPTVAIVDDNGVVTGVTKGTAVITASSFNNKRATCRVTVLNAPTALRFEQDTFLLAEGMRLALPVEGVDDDGDPAMGVCTWSADHPEVVSVDDDGVVTALSIGTAVVTASMGELRASCEVTVTSAPADMVLNHETLNIGVKENYKGMVATLTASDGTNFSAADVVWSTSNSKIATVDAETGAITGVKKGSATISARTYNGIVRNVRVTVQKAPSQVTVSPSTLRLSEGMIDQLKPSLKKGTASGQFTYTSSDPEVVEVDQEGRVKGKAKGSATITVRTFNGKTATCRATVFGTPAMVSVNQEYRLVQDMTDVIAPAALDAEGDETPASFTFSIDPASEDPGCIRLDETTGAVTAVRRGSAVVQVTANGAITASCEVRVVAAPVDMTLSDSAVEIGVKEVYQPEEPQLTPPFGEDECQAVITWRSAKPKVAKVDEKTGTITGVKAGTTTIYARTHNGLERTISVKVGKAPSKVVLSPTSKHLIAGMSFQLNASVNNKAASGRFTYESNNPDVATVDEEGLVVGLSEGTAVITVTSYNGKSARCAVTVEGAASGDLTLSPNPLNLALGASWKLSVETGDALPTYGCEYDSSDPSVATVDEDGTVHALSRGDAEITATALNGSMGSCRVHVIGACAQVFLDEDDIEMAPGAVRTLNTTVVDGSGNPGVSDYTFRLLEGAGVVRVDASGKVTALKAGSAVIGVTTSNGVDSHVDFSGSSVLTVCRVTVSEGVVARIELPDELSIRVGETLPVKPVLLTSQGVEVTGEYTLSVIGDAAVVDEKNQLIGVYAGEATLVASTARGVSTSCRVTVTDVRYRFFGAYEYGDTSDSHALYFAKNNTESVWEVLSNTQIDGVSFEKRNILRNPSKKSLLSGLSTAFADSRDGDVNVVYLLSHGFDHIDVSSSKSVHYGWAIPGYKDYKSDSKYYLTAEEIFDAVSAINGKVILILDSCFSGVFITNMRSRLNAANGRITVLTAASDTKASYYDGKNTSTDFDFFTYYLLYGLNYDMNEHAYGVGYNADANRDGKVTVDEFFQYGHDEVTDHLPGFGFKSWFHGNASQTPSYFAGKNGSLVIYQR